MADQDNNSLKGQKHLYHKGIAIESNDKEKEFYQLFKYYNDEGNSLNNLKRYEEAIKIYNKAIELDPHNSSYYDNKGQSLHYLNRNVESIQMFNKAIELDPHNANYYNNKGISFDNQMRFEEAIKIYDKAIGLDPHNSIYYHNKGKSLHNQERFDEAIQMYDKALALYPHNSTYYINKGEQFIEALGNSFHELKRYKEAIQMFDQAIKLDPNNSISYNNKAYSLVSLELYEEANQMYDKAIYLDPRDPAYYNNKGQSLDKLKQYEEAILMYDEAIRLKPHQAMFLQQQRLIICKKFQDNHFHIQKDIIKQCKCMIKLYFYIHIFLLIAQIKEICFTIQRGMKMYDKAIKLDQDYFYNYIKKGYSLINLQRYDEADLSFTKPIEMQKFKLKYIKQQLKYLHSSNHKQIYQFITQIIYFNQIQH